MATLPGYKDALCANFIVWGCSDASSKTAACCGLKDEMLYRTWKMLSLASFQAISPCNHVPTIQQMQIKVVSCAHVARAK